MTRSAIRFLFQLGASGALLVMAHPYRRKTAALAVMARYLYYPVMTAKEFRNVFDAQPFRPFTIFLADGRQVPVRHQEFAMLSPSGRTLIVYQEDDSFQVIDLMLATGVKVNGTNQKRPPPKQG